MALEIILFASILAISTTLNGIVIFVLISSRKHLHSKDFIILSLASCGLIETLFSMPYSINDYNKNAPNLPASTLCRVSAFMVTFLAITSISHTAVLSVKFWVAVKHPFWSREKEQKRYFVLWLIIPCWFYGFLWAIFPLIGWSSYGKEIDGGRRCGMNFREYNANVVSYNIALLLAAFFVPVTACAYCYLGIISAYREMKLNARLVSGSKSLMAYKTQRQLVCHYVMNAVMLGTFVIVWSPYASLAFLHLIGVEGSATLHDAAAILAKSATCYNPIAYAIFNKQFRRYTKQALCSAACKGTRRQCKTIHQSVQTSTYVSGTCV